MSTNRVMYQRHLILSYVCYYNSEYHLFDSESNSSFDLCFAIGLVHTMMCLSSFPVIF